MIQLCYIIININYSTYMKIYVIILLFTSQTNPTFFQLGSLKKSIEMHFQLLEKYTYIDTEVNKKTETTNFQSFSTKTTSAFLQLLKERIKSSWILLVIKKLIANNKNSDLLIMYNTSPVLTTAKS